MKLPKTKPSSTTTSTQTSSAPTTSVQEMFTEGRDLFSIWGKSEDELFAVGDAGTLLHTKDAGKSWEKIKLKDVPQSLYSIWGNGQTIFIAGAEGVLLRSRDGGANWLQMRGIPKEDLLSVWGNSPDDIYVAGRKSTLLHATDGATFVSAKPLVEANLFGGWSDTKTSLVCGADGLLLRSLDQGKTWETLTTNASVDLRSVWSTGSAIYAIGHKPPSRGKPPRTELVSSSDGVTFGVTSLRGEGRAISGDGKNFYAIGAYLSTISLDQGATWSNWIAPNQHEALRTLYDLWVSPSGKIYIVGQRGLVLRLEAGSPTMTMLSGSLPVTWYDAIILPDGSLLASGWQGNLIRWKDNTIELLPSNTDDSLERLVQIDTKIFAFGSMGAVLVSEDSGTSWRFLRGLEARLFRDALFHGKLYALSTERLMVSSSGESWSSLWSSSEQRPYSFFATEKAWFMVGEMGYIATSRDASSWRKQESGVKQDLFSVWAANESEVFVVGASGVILHTADGGDSWQPQTSGVKQNLTDVLGVSASEVFVIGTDGVLLQTKDAGQSWQRLSAPKAQSLSSIALDSSFLYIVGDSVIARYERAKL